MSKLSLPLLNDKQTLAVQTIHGKLLILAGAGSGKTKVLMSRMAYMISQGIDPQVILGLTFTNKAAGEMRKRLGQHVDPQIAQKVMLSTYHSFCLQLLRKYAPKLGYTSNFSLYSQYEIRRLIGQIVRDELSHNLELPSFQPVVELIDRARQIGKQPKDLTYPSNPWLVDFSQTVFDKLKIYLRAYNAIDFDGLLELVLSLWDENPDILEQTADAHQYIMIDEYQDTNPVQDLLAHRLASKYGHLCVVGDDDQSIYEWRGAQVANILQFQADNVIKLEQNYRSTNHILHVANKIISNNSKRYDKTLWSDLGDGSKIEVFHAPEEKDEAESVVARMISMHQSGISWNDMAILYRSNAVAKNFETALINAVWKNEVNGQWQKGIPYQMFGGDSFYEAREVKDILAYARLINNPKDSEALLRVINQPRRGIGETTLDSLTAIQRTRKIPLIQVLQEHVLQHPSNKVAGNIANFLEFIEKATQVFHTLPLPEALAWLVTTVDYEKVIKEEVKSEAMRQFKRKNIAELIQSSNEYVNLEKSEQLTEFINHSQLEPSPYLSQNIKNNCVTMMTFHSSKGLEYPICFLVGMEDHIMPHEKSVQEGRIEEERRLMYVAVTRAMKKAIITMSRQRVRNGKKNPSNPSRFIFEIPNELLVPVNYLDLDSWKKI